MNVWLSVPRYSPVMRVFYTSCPWFVASLLKPFVCLLFSLKSIVLIKFDDWMSRLTWFEMMWCDVWIITLLNPYNTSNPNHLTTEWVVNQAVFWVASSLLQTLVVCLSSSPVQILLVCLCMSLVQSVLHRVKQPKHLTKGVEHRGLWWKPIQMATCLAAISCAYCICAKTFISINNRNMFQDPSHNMFQLP